MARVDTGDDESVLMPVPAVFTAAILNTYEDEAASPVTVIDVAAEAV